MKSFFTSKNCVVPSVKCSLLHAVGITTGCPRQAGSTQRTWRQALFAMEFSVCISLFAAIARRGRARKQMLFTRASEPAPRFWSTQRQRENGHLCRLTANCKAEKIPQATFSLVFPMAERRQSEKTGLI